MSVNDRVYLFHREGRPTMVVVRTSAAEEWVIGASYARQLAADLLRAANEAMNKDLAEYALSEVTLTRGHMGAALDEARDEGHAAGRAEALEEAADFLETTKILGDQDAANRLAAALRALAGKP